MRADLTAEQRRFTFLHLALPDAAGHASDWMSLAYQGAVLETDRLLGELLDTIDASPRLRKRLVVVLTADHGGPPGETSHDDARTRTTTDPVRGLGPRGPGRRPLRAQPRLRRAGHGQPSYDGPQPVRNGDLANLATDLLGLGPVPGSELDAGQDLDWR